MPLLSTPGSGWAMLEGRGFGLLVFLLLRLVFVQRPPLYHTGIHYFVSFVMQPSSFCPWIVLCLVGGPRLTTLDLLLLSMLLGGLCAGTTSPLLGILVRLLTSFLELLTPIGPCMLAMMPFLKLRGVELVCRRLLLVFCMREFTLVHLLVSCTPG